ncbi:MAG: hypothetical protein K9H64_05060 [Bacteroidales bacterium]|nr:hypothetical protein [Bacteroidales bacterium]MCF8455207.1 hypothetical protein [Bacteroidales bacterium]
MILEKTSKEILLKISPNIDKYGIQRLMDYAEYLEMTANSKASQEDADNLADELNENWWNNNKDRFLK